MAYHSRSSRAKNRRPWEFSKKLAAWAVAFILAAMDKQPVGDVTTAIFTACIGYLVTYAAKSTTEKISRNRHGLDADGVPIGQEGTEG